MAKFANDRIEVFCGPPSLGAPDDLGDAIVDFIDGAEHTLDIAVQELESRDITEAIVGARQRGVRIRMVVEQDYLRANRAARDPFDLTRSVEDEENRALFAVLLRAGIDVRADYNPKIFHQKFIVRDFGEDRRGVLTGSTNFTPTGIGRHASKQNLNHVVILHDAYIAREFNDEFEEIWGGTFGKARHRHESEPLNRQIDGVLIRPIFAPDHTPELEIMKQCLKAKERIDFAIFTFAQSSGIDDTLAVRAAAGLPVRGAFENMQANQKWAATRIVADAGADCWLAKHDDLLGAGHEGHLGKLHHKLMTLDDKVTIVGSFNYTSPANRLNDENILIIGDFYEQDEDAKATQRDIALYFRKEIDRIIEHHGEAVEVQPEPAE